MDDYIFHLEMKAQPKQDCIKFTRAFTIHDYTLRVTNKNKDEILKSIKKMTQKVDVELWVVGFEENHCHLVFQPWCKGKEFRDDVKKIFGIKEAKNYSLSKIRDSPLKALSYVLKDGDYNVGRDVCPEQLQTAKKLCFGKGNKSFKKSHDILLESLAKDNDRKRYFKAYVNLKIHHNQKIYWHHIKAHCTTVFMKMDEYYRNDLIQSKWVDSGLMSKEESDDYYHNNGY